MSIEVSVSPLRERVVSVRLVYDDVGDFRVGRLDHIGAYGLRARRGVDALPVPARGSEEIGVRVRGDRGQHQDIGIIRR